MEAEDKAKRRNDKGRAKTEGGGKKDRIKGGGQA
jgi:hypothetical protein